MAVKDRKNRKRLIRLGIIRLGHKEQGTRADGSTYEYPVQDDHFLLHDAPDVEEYYRRRGIAEVRELRVRLPFADAERSMPAWYQVWAGGVIVCQGDGEYVDYAAPFTCAISEKTGRTSVRNASGDTVVANGIAQIAFDWGDVHFEAGEHVPCPGSSADAYPHCAACKLNNILKVLMAPPELLRLGYYQISTGSGRNYDTIRGTLELLPPQFLNQLEYTLRLVEGQTSYKDGEGVTHQTTRYFLELEPDPEMLQELFSREWQHTLGSGQVRQALPETIEADDVWDEPFDEEPVAPPPYAEVQQPQEPVVVVTPPPRAEGPTTNAQDPTQYKMKVGKHKGKTIAQIGAEDSSYLEWVLDNMDEEKYDNAVLFETIRAWLANEQEPVEQGTHKWTKQEAAKLIAWTRETLGLNDEDVLFALNVSKISEFPSDYETAERVINAYVSAQMVEDPEQDEEEPF